MKPPRPFGEAELADLRPLAAMERTPRGALKAVAAKHGRCYQCAAAKLFDLRCALRAAGNPPEPVLSRPRRPETFAELMTRLTAEHEAAEHMAGAP